MKTIALCFCILFAAAAVAAAEDTSQADLAKRVGALERKTDQMEKDIAQAKQLPAPKSVIIQGSSTLSWQYDLLSSGTGFYHELDLKLRVPLDSGSRVKSYEKRGMPLRAVLSVSRFDLSAQNQGFFSNPGTVDARLIYGDYFMSLATNPTFLQDKAQPLADVNNNIRVSNVNSTAGVTVGYSGRGTSLAFSVGSDDYGIHNPFNKYAFGLDGKFRVIKRYLSLETGAVWGARLGYVRNPDIDFQSRDVGFSVKPVFTLPFIAQGAQLSLAGDFGLPYDLTENRYQGTGFDARGDLQIDLSKVGVREDGSEGKSYVKLSVYTIPEDWLVDARISFSELYGNAGILPILGGNLAFTLLNILQQTNWDLNIFGLGWEITGNLNAKLGSFIPYLSMTYGTSNSFYEDELGLAAGMKIDPLDNVEFQAEYLSSDVNHNYDPTGKFIGDMGTVTFSTKLSF